MAPCAWHRGTAVKAEAAGTGDDAPDSLRVRLRTILGVLWIGVQAYLLFAPQAPYVERPLHLALATAVLLLWVPLFSGGSKRAWIRLDRCLVAMAMAGGGYFLAAADRLGERMEGVDPVAPLDMACGVLVLALVLEGVRRAVGWPLLGVLLGFLAYGFAGPWMPGWLRFSGFGFEQAVEILALSLNGILGITTSTSLHFVFYFILFGAAYTEIGGGRLLIDMGLRLAGAGAGGTAKAAVISSSLMGSVTGSAVANVAGTGVFTIPLMRRAGYSAETAAALEAIASTGGQLMPPIMGVAAFVMAEMLQVDYASIALAALIPAAGFYAALLVSVDLRARATGIGTLPRGETAERPTLRGRLHLLLPPAVLVGALAANYSAPLAAFAGTVACALVGIATRGVSRTGLRQLARVADRAAQQASRVAVPIAAVGIVVAVAIQSNLALKFTGQLLGEGASPALSTGLIVIGCLVMGMGLPTVAAYLIGAVLFAPALEQLGIASMAAHFFVMYFCVLSMVTPPVALASYTAAGIAGGSVLKTSARAFGLSVAAFLIPFGFAFDPALLGEGAAGAVLAAILSLLAGTAGWAAAVVGHWRRPLGLLERGVLGASAVTVICVPAGTAIWACGCVALLLAAGWASMRRPPAPSGEPPRSE